MNCAEFQKVLPYIIESGGNVEEEDHLRTCHICSDLVRDLRYIAEQAKLLVPMEDPNPKVWDGIQKSLEQEGIVKPGSKPNKGGPLKMTVKVTCVGILGLAAILLAMRSYASTTTTAGYAAPPVVQTSAR